MAPDLDERVEAVEVSKVVEIDGKNDMNLSCCKDPPTVGGDCNGIVHEDVKDDGDGSYVFVDGDETVYDDPVEKDPVTVADPSGELELGGEKNVTSSPTEEKQVEIDQSDVVSSSENDVAVDGSETNQGEVEKDDTVKEELDALVEGSEEPVVKSIEADESELGKPDTEITAEKELKLEDETSGVVAEVDESKLLQENDGEEKVQEEALKNSAVNCSQTEAPGAIVKELENLDDVDQTSKVEVAEELETNQSLEKTSEEMSKPEVAEEVETIHNAEETAEETSKVEADEQLETNQSFAYEELETNQSSLPHQLDNVEETAEETSTLEVAEESETSQSSLSRQLDNVEETAEETSKPEGAEELETNQSSFSHQLAEVEDKAEETSKPDAAEESEINQNSSTHQLDNGEVKAEETEELEAAEEAEINQKCPPDQLKNGQEKLEETRKPEATEESDISQDSSHQIDDGVEKTEEANNIEAVYQDEAIHSSPIGKVDNGVDKAEEANNVEAVEEAEVIKNSPTHEICNGVEKAEEADRIDAVEESEMIQSSPTLEIDNLGKVEEENSTEVNEETSKLEVAEESELNLNSPPHCPNEGEDKVERANDLEADEESEVNERHTDNQLDNVEENAIELSKAKNDEESEMVQSTTSHLLDNVEEKAGETNIPEEAKELEIIQSTSREVPESGSQQLDNGEKVAETCKSTSSAAQKVDHVSQTVTEFVDTELYHLDHTVTESVDTELHCLDHGKEHEAVRVANQIPIEDPAEHFETEQSVVEIVTCPSDVRQVDVEDMVDASESVESISTCPVEQTIPKIEVNHSVKHGGNISTCPISETESETECVKGSIENYKSLAHAADEVRSKSEVEDTEIDRVGEGSIERVHSVTDVPVDEVEIKSEAPNGRSSWADEVVDDEQSDIPVDDLEIESEAPDGRSSWADEVVEDEQSDIPVDDLEIESAAPDGCCNLADGAVDDAHLESEDRASSVPSKGVLSDTNGLKDRSMPNSDNEVPDATNEGDKSAKCDNTGVPIAEEAAVHEGIENNGGLPASPKEAANDVLEVQKVDDEVIRRPFRFLIRIPRYVDDSIRDQIGLAQQEVEEKTQSRDAIRLKLQSLRAISSEYREKFEAARSEERAARDVLTAKRREMDSIQLIISRIKNENSIDDIDDKVHNMEHRIQHETMPLKEEKQLIRDIKQLKNLREQVCSSLNRETEEITPEQRDRVEERYQSKKKEIDIARKEVQRAEGITKVTRKIYFDESEKIKNLQDQFKVADGLRQKAYFQLQNLKKQLYEKNRYFRTYKEDAKRAEDFAFSADRDALQHLCVNQVEAVMELWNKNDEFRNEYIRCNKMSTLRRLRTLDGRALGPDEEPPILYHAVDQRINSTSGSSANPITSTSSVLTSEKGKSVVADVKPIVGVEEPNPKANVTSVVKLEQKNPKAISKKETIPEVLENGSATVSGREQTVEKVDKNKKKEEEELRNKAEELARKVEEFRKAEAAAKLKEQLKEQKRLEEKAKAKEAEERKRRNAEKAQARAELRAQKEAELKEKEREKRAKKKEKKKAAAAEASTGGAETESTSVEVNLPETTRELEIKEKPKTVTKKPQKPSVLAKQTKAKVIPPPLRNRSKKRLQQWLWGALVAVLVAVMLYAKLSILSNNAA